MFFVRWYGTIRMPVGLSFLSSVLSIYWSRRKRSLFYLVFGSFALEGVRRAWRHGRKPRRRRRQRHVAYRLTDDLPNCLQECVAEIGRAAKNNVLLNLVARYSVLNLLKKLSCIHNNLNFVVYTCKYLNKIAIDLGLQPNYCNFPLRIPRVHEIQTLSKLCYQIIIVIREKIYELPRRQLNKTSLNLIK